MKTTPVLPIENNKTKRNRAIAHLWCDKRVVRYFRELWKDDKITSYEYQQLKLVYFAFCEIDSDFAGNRNTENKIELHSLTKMIVTYSGLSIGVASKAMQCLKEFGLIEYKQIREGSRATGTSLEMYEFIAEELNDNFEDAMSRFRNSEIIKSRNYQVTKQNKNDSKESSLYKKEPVVKKSSRTKPVKSSSQLKKSPELFQTKKDTSKHFISMLPRPYQDNEAFIEVWVDYLQSRKHKATQQAVKRIINDLIEGAGSDIAYAIDCFNLTIKKGWVIPYYTLPKKDAKQPEQTTAKREKTRIGPTQEYDYTKDRNYVPDDDMSDIPGLGGRK